MSEDIPISVYLPSCRRVVMFIPTNECYDTTTRQNVKPCLSKTVLHLAYVLVKTPFYTYVQTRTINSKRRRQDHDTTGNRQSSRNYNRRYNT